MFLSLLLFFLYFLLYCEGAREILDTMKVASVLIKGGHFEDDDEITSSVSQDYFLSQRTNSYSDNTMQEEHRRRLCDGNYGVWLRGPRLNSTNTHGTGCTLSSSIAAALALGRQKYTSSASTDNTGSSAIDDLLNACCLAKAYVTAGIDNAVQVSNWIENNEECTLLGATTSLRF
jgi:hydroxymethylpyrimidine/phosphomethylpyrimidine kinase